MYNGIMNSAPEAAAFERGIQPILNRLVLNHELELADLQPEPCLAARIEELARKSNEGDLSEEEYAEYQGYVRANKFIAVLQRQARRVIESRAGSDE